MMEYLTSGAYPVGVVIATALVAVTAGFALGWLAGRAGKRAQKEQFRLLAKEILQIESARLKTDNAEQLSHVLAPLQEQLTWLDRAVQDARSDAAGKASAVAQMIKLLADQTQALGKDAAQLTRALKGDSKIQGDWGEMVLDQLLETSGLERGTHYDVQPGYTVDGRRFRPDVVLHLPGPRHIVIDAKTSLTAYAEAMAAETREARQAALADHVRSVEKHIKELAEKPYTSLEANSLEYVLMFIPNEAAYIAAVRQDPTLPARALKQRILLVSPANLVMALQLTAFLWQKETGRRNVERIVERAGLLLKKFDLVCSAFAELGDSLAKAQRAYDSAQNRLVSGQGNFADQVQELARLSGNNASRS